MIIYIAGRYNGGSKEEIAGHIQKARDLAIQVWKSGNVAICPHLNTALFNDEPELQYLTNDDYVNRDLEIVARCDAVLLVDNWEQSDGAKKEKAYAESRGIPIIYPNQTFPMVLSQDIPLNQFWHYYFMCLDQAKQLASGSKNNDYNSGKVNILDYWVFGSKSVFHMVHQKVLRLKSLLTSGNKPQNEKLEDTCVDLINYTAFLYAQLQLEKSKITLDKSRGGYYFESKLNLNKGEDL